MDREIRESRIQFGCALATCLTMVLGLVVVAALFSLSTVVIVRRDTGAPAAPSASAPPLSRLAFIGTDGNVHTISPDGTGDVSLTSDANTSDASRTRRLYLFPTWSPDGRHVAFVELNSEGTASLQRADPAVGKPSVIFSSGDQVPVYLSWSPDSRRLAFLAEHDDILALRYADPQGNGDELAAGAPIYFAWAPDSKSLVSHVGGSRRVSAEATVGVHAFDGNASRNLALEPGSFSAPAFSPDGFEVLTAQMGQTENDNSLVASSPAGGAPRKLASYRGSIAFAWSPDGKQVAYLVTPERLGVGTQLRLVNADGTGDQLLAENSVMAFFWSPDGKRIAHLARATGTEGALHLASGLNQQDRLRLAWNVITLADRKTVGLGTFIPTSPYLEMVPYFDQYMQSFRIWSPDSTSLVYAAQEREDSAGIYVVRIDGAQPRRVASGVIAGWSWR